MVAERVLILHQGDDLDVGEVQELVGSIERESGDVLTGTRVTTYPAACATCLRIYPANLIHLRDMKREGTPMAGTVSSADGARQVDRALGMTACLDCGGEVAVWVYDPQASGR
jgi:hypothetical protein